MALTRFEHYDSLPRSPHGRGHTWTRESALTALALYVQDTGRLPLTSHLRSAEGLPNHQTVARLFGSFHAYLQAQDAVAVPPSSYAKEVGCPRCGRRWPSPDARSFRQCRSCHQAIKDGLLDQGGEWMNGETVVHAGIEEVELWEDHGDDF